MMFMYIIIFLKGVYHVLGGKASRSNSVAELGVCKM
jgi:hypothetical protein